MPRSLCLAAVLGAVVLLGPVRPAAAQFFSFDGGADLAVQSVSAAYSLIDFSFDGEEEPLLVFDFDQPVYGLVYARPRILITFFVGDQDADDQGRQDLRLLDVSLATWGELYLQGLGEGRTRVFVPILLFSNYRRVAPRGDATEFDAFNVTVLGLGAGLGLRRAFGEAVLFETRAHPIFGLSSSSFVDAVGTAHLFEADAQLHLARLLGRLGLSLGYTFRSQVWNVNASDLFPDLTDELFDYRGRQHLFRLGVNW